MSPEIHPAAAVGFERATDAYERGRPGYPADAVAHVIARLAIAPGRTVLDLAAGTGKLTRDLVAAGAEVIAVEPVEAMRVRLAGTLPSVRILAGTAEAIALRDGSVDAATVAQAFHWFDAPAALAELARVLRRHGRLALMWNVRDEDDPLQAALSELMAPYRGDTPSHRDRDWRAILDAADGFAAPELSSFRHEQALGPDGIVDRVLSVSFMAGLPDPEKAGVAEAIRELVGDRDGLVLPYRTDVWISERR